MKGYRLPGTDLPELPEANVYPTTAVVVLVQHRMYVCMCVKFRRQNIITIITSYFVLRII